MRNHLALCIVLLLMSLGGRGVESATQREFQAGGVEPSTNGQPRASASPLIKGGILVVEACGRGLLLIDRETKQIVWQARGLRGAKCVASLPTGGLVVGEGTSIALIDRNGNLASRLPVRFQRTSDVKALEEGKLLVSDGAAGTVTEMDWRGNILWQVTRLHWPSEAVRLENGNTRVADGTGLLKEFNSRGELMQKTKLKRWAAAVQRLSNGDTLVGEAGAVELLDATGNTIWSLDGFPRATSVQQLPDGEILVCVPDRDRVVILDATGKVIWERTRLKLPGQAIVLQ